MRRQPNGRRGSALIYVLVALVALTGFCSLAVDWGRVQAVKGELQLAADAAARYAAPAVGQGISAVRTRAKAAAAENKADGTPIVLADADIEEGNWSVSTKVFVANAAPLNAVRVTARRAGADAVPLMFARVFGKNSFDVRASAIIVRSTAPLGIVGLDGITFHNNSFIGSYNSTSTKNPNKATSTGKSALSSNGVIEAHNQTEIDGDVTLGPSGSVIDIDVDGTITRLASPIVVPANPSWSPGTNPLNLPQAYTINSVTTLPGGTYWFTSWDVNRAVSFSGPAVVYVNGDISVEKDSITAYNSVPSNLKIYQLGANRAFSANNNFKMTAEVFAPGSEFVANNQFTLYGNAVFRTIECKNNTDLFLDENSMGGAGAAGGAGARMVR